MNENNTKESLPISSKIYDEEFLPYIIRHGRFLNSLGIVFAFIPCIVLVIIGYSPDWGAVLSGFLSQASVSGIYWILEPIRYFFVFGVPGTYLAFLSGNATNIRWPAAMAAQDAADCEQGTPEGSCIATVGIAVSVIVNLIILTCAIIGGSMLLSSLPATITTSFNNILPALYGALGMSMVIRTPKYAVVGLPVGIGVYLLIGTELFNFLPTSILAVISMFTSIIITILLCSKLFRKKEGD